jgi:hypothetical protein
MERKTLDFIRLSGIDCLGLISENFDFELVAVLNSVCCKSKGAKYFYNDML